MKLTDAQEQWLTALEDGSYTQTTGALRDAEGFCCLGVACDLYDSDGWDCDLYPAIGVLPKSVRAHLGLRSDVGHFNEAELERADARDIESMICYQKPASLATLNDRGCSFEEIAGIIRRNPNVVFEKEMSDATD